jgi:hypothetical protein
MDDARPPQLAASSLMLARSRRPISPRGSDYESRAISLVDKIEDVGCGLEPFQPVLFSPFVVRYCLF